MCGIVGYWGSGVEPATAQGLLHAMSSAIAHRGPDAEGAFVGADVGLGHVRLSIVGLADGQQPMRAADADVHITFNGEIFNYIELRDDLIARGHRFRTGSDTEVILALYLDRGLDALEALNGDFAFALFDGRTRRLILARDRMGVRPLFYAWRGDTLFFASEIKALLTVPGITAEIDPIALDQTFTLWHPIAPRTHFKDIAELPPAHVMVLEAGRHDLRRYWSLDFPDSGDATPARSESEASSQLRSLLEDATRIRLRADVPVGSYLSGGLDSSIVSAMAARMVSDRLRTFSVTFDTEEHDESAFQQQMVDALGTDHSAVACGFADLAAAFPDVIRHTERPILRTAPAPLYLLSSLARSEGFKVVLTGEGADEVFAGYDIFKEAHVRRFSARQPASKFRPLLFRRLYPYLPGLQQQSAEYLAAFFGGGAADLDDPLFSHRPRLRSTAATKTFFSTGLRQTLAGYDAAEELASQLPADFARWHPLHQAQYLETAYLLPGYILSSQGDRMAMAHGVEGRFPFLDHRLVEFAATLPPGLKLKGLTEKHILRESARDLLPPGIGQRTKQPYRAPDSVSFSGPTAPAYVNEAMGPAEIAASGLFNPLAVSKLMQKSAAAGVSGFRDNAAYVGILSTQLWHRQFITTAANKSIRAA